MKLTIKTKPLASALGRIKSVISSRTTLPILSNVLLEAEDGKLKLTGTDMTRYLTLSLEADVTTTGKITVPCSFLYEITSKIGSADIYLESDAKLNLSVEGETRRSKLPGLPSEEFPAIPDEKGEYGFRIDGPVFANMLSRLSPFMGTDHAARPILCSINFQTIDGKLALLAASSHALLVWKSDVPSDIPSIVLPDSSVSTLAGSCGDGEVRITVGERHLISECEGARFISLLFDGSYPNALAAIPQDSALKGKITASREELMSSLDYVASSVEFGLKGVNISVSDAEMTITGSGRSGGDSRSTVKLESGTPIDFTASATLLLNSLKAIKSDSASIEFINRNSPFVIRHESLTATLMPMRVEPVAKQTKSSKSEK